MSRFLAIPEEWLDSDNTHHRLLIWIAKRATALGYERCTAGQVAFSVRDVAKRFDIPTTTAYRWIAKVIDQGLLVATHQAARQAGFGEVYDLVGVLRLAVLPGERNKDRNIDRNKEEKKSNDLPPPVEQGVEQQPERLVKESTSTHLELLATGGTGAAIKSLLEDWNTKAAEVGMTHCQGIHGAYLPKVKARLEEPGWLESFQELLSLIHLDAYYRGKNQPGKVEPWVANLLFFIREPYMVERHLVRLKAIPKKKEPAKKPAVPVGPVRTKVYTEEETIENERLLEEVFANFRRQNLVPVAS